MDDDRDGRRGRPRLIDGRYRLERRLGRGGMGEVFLATQLVLERRCAVKLLQPRRLLDARSVSRFRTEAEALALLDHPAIVRITDYGVDRDSRAPFLVMEYAPGRSLRRVLEEDGPLPLGKATAILDQTAAALAYAHERGVIHGDLKPDNLILVEDGEQPVVKLLDLGLASFSAADAVDPDRSSAESTAHEAATMSTNDSDVNELTAATRTMAGAAAVPGGTFGYMAPELLFGCAASPASDHYAFAVMAAELLSGRRPPQGIQAIGTPEVEKVLTAALTAAPEARPPATRLSVSLVDIARRHRLAGWRCRTRVARIAAVAVITAVSLGSAWLAHDSRAAMALQGRWTDLGFAVSASRPAHPSLLQVEIDDASLAADPTPLVDRGDRIGRLLHRAIDAGAAGVGIDILLPADWGRAPGFIELVVGHPEQVVLAAQSVSGTAIGHEVVGGLITVALGPQRSRDLFGVVNVAADGDGTIRHGRCAVADAEGRLHPTFAARLTALVRPVARNDRPFLIDFRIAPDAVESIGIEDLAGLITAQPQRLAGRILLVGQTFSGAGDDHHRVPRPGSLGATINGLGVQAVTVSTLLDEQRLCNVPEYGMMTAASVLVLLAGWLALGSLHIRTTWICFAAASLLMLATAAGSFLWLNRSHDVTGAVIVLVSGLTATMVLRRALPRPPRAPWGVEQ